MRMKFAQQTLRQGDVVVVHVNYKVNVLLMDFHNFNAYRTNRTFNYYGGLANRSPVRLTVPRDGIWYVVIDTGGAGGTVRFSVEFHRLVESPLNEINTTEEHSPSTAKQLGRWPLTRFMHEPCEVDKSVEDISVTDMLGSHISFWLSTLKDIRSIKVEHDVPEMLTVVVRRNGEEFPDSAEFQIVKLDDNWFAQRTESTDVK